MPCLLVVLALAVPRLAIAGLWLFTDWFRGMFDSLLWPALGFVFLPTTLVWYSIVQQWMGGEWGVGAIAGVVVALILDTSPAKGGRRG